MKNEIAPILDEGITGLEMISAVARNNCAGMREDTRMARDLHGLNSIHIKCLVTGRTLRHSTVRVFARKLENDCPHKTRVRRLLVSRSLEG